MCEQNDPCENLNTGLEREKLKLEIRQLEIENSWTDRLVKLGSVMTTLVAVAGLVLTAWNTQRAREIEEAARVNAETQDRVNKIQTQIRADKEQILEFVTNDKISATRVAFLLDDLKSLTEELPTDKTATQPDKLKTDARDSVTELLRRAAWELRFDQGRQFDFDVYALLRWNDYRQLWKDRPNEHQHFLSNKYHLRLQQLRGEDARCIGELDYAEGTTILIYKSACNQELIGALIHAFGEHLKVIREANQTDLFKQEALEFAKLTSPAFSGKFFASL
ncbi:MAG: hypothetical protein WAM70_02695 [Pyrinomonadaceae bacterium]